VKREKVRYYELIYEIMAYAYIIAQSPDLKRKLESDFEKMQKSYKRYTGEKKCKFSLENFWHQGLIWLGVVFFLIIISIPLKNKESKKSQIQTTTHIVKFEDTLSKIAKKYNLSILDISAFNKLKDIDQSKIGQRLLISKRCNINETKEYLKQLIEAKKYR